MCLVSCVCGHLRVGRTTTRQSSIRRRGEGRKGRGKVCLLLDVYGIESESFSDDGSEGGVVEGACRWVVGAEDGCAVYDVVNPPKSVADVVDLVGRESRRVCEGW